MKNPNSRKLNQLKGLSTKLHTLILQSKGKTTDQIKRIIAAMQRLVQELRQSISGIDLKKALGAAALFFGLAVGQQATAQNFLPPVAQPFGLTQGYYIGIPAHADLDNDGDLDVLIGEYYGVMNYYENIGSATNPVFATPVSNPFGLDSVMQFAMPEFADMDNDGDMDLFVGEYYGNILYFKNIGTLTTPNFAVPIQNPFGLQQAYYFGMPAVADMDGDGDNDMIIGEYDGNFQYYKNIGTLTTPNFAVPVTNPFGLTQTYEYAFLDLGDLDNDGDVDIMVGEYYGVFKYFENIGTSVVPAFQTPLSNPFGLDSTLAFAFPEFIDMDGDGDLDMLVGEYYGTINYYENGVAIGIPEAEKSFELSLFPNPTRNVLNITTDEQLSKIEIVDLTGRVVFTEPFQNKSVDVRALKSGTYFIRLTSVNGLVSVEKFQKI